MTEIINKSLKYRTFKKTIAKELINKMQSYYVGEWLSPGLKLKIKTKIEFSKGVACDPERIILKDKNTFISLPHDRIDHIWIYKDTIYFYIKQL